MTSGISAAAAVCARKNFGDRLDPFIRFHGERAGGYGEHGAHECSENNEHGDGNQYLKSKFPSFNLRFCVCKSFLSVRIIGRQHQAKLIPENPEKAMAISAAARSSIGNPRKAFGGSE